MNPANHLCQSNCLSRFSVGSIRQLILLIATLVLATAYGKVKEQAIPAGSRVLALGDSLTAGASAHPQKLGPICWRTYPTTYCMRHRAP